jgi:hypothetical protein
MADGKIQIECVAGYAVVGPFDLVKVGRRDCSRER